MLAPLLWLAAGAWVAKQVRDVRQLLRDIRKLDAEIAIAELELALAEAAATD